MKVVLNFICVNVYLLLVMGPLEEFIDLLFIALFNIDLNEVRLNKGNDIEQWIRSSTLLLLDEPTKLTELGILKLYGGLWISLEVRNKLLVLMFKNLSNVNLGLCHFVLDINLGIVTFDHVLLDDIGNIKLEFCSVEMLFEVDLVLRNK